MQFRKFIPRVGNKRLPVRMGMYSICLDSSKNADAGINIADGMNIPKVLIGSVTRGIGFVTCDSGFYSYFFR